MEKMKILCFLLIKIINKNKYSLYELLQCKILKMNQVKKYFKIMLKKKIKISKLKIK